MASRGIERTEIGEGTSHEGFLRHRDYKWLKIAAALCAVATLAYLLIDVEPRPNGGSWYGYTLGTIGALLILWLTALGVRKRAITRKRWSLKAWTSAHVYLGLSLIVIATLHTGFQFGLNIHTLAYVLMMLVILSGIYGIWAYAFLPAALSDNRSEMTAAQMIDAVESIDKQIQISAQPLSDEDSQVVLDSLGEDPFGGGLFRRLSGKPPKGGNAVALKIIRRRAMQCEGAEAIALDQVSVLMQRKAGALNRIRRHVRIRARLEVWLYVHVPLTFALIAALSAHIISVFFYW
ncbi:MAG TPA: hypothetical protein VK614_03415 [Allosphingosinicella sp.]|nr:hypothetical protein [Allosphingosinicella sp.]